MRESEVLSDYYLDERDNLNDYVQKFLLNPSYFIPRFLSEKTNLKKAIYALANISKKKVCADMIFKYFDKDGTLIDKFVLCGDSKVRKNSYILIGNVGFLPYQELLLDRLNKETTYYCFPSLILALGNLACPVKILKEFEVKFSNLKDENLTLRQREDILTALKKAIDKNTKCNASFEGYIYNQQILLTTLQSAKPFLKSELEKLDIPITKELNEGYVIKYTNDFRGIRCYYDAYLYFSDLYLVKKEHVFEIIVNKLDPEYFARMFVMDKKLNYRISLISQDNMGVKKAFIEKLEKQIALKSKVFCNSASNYAFDIVVKKLKDDYSVLIRLTLDKDNRFNYRKNNLPASINPVTANIVAHFASKYVNSQSNVCDPFCGSGTMLIELGKIAKVKSLVGVDIFVKAITYAKENAKLSNIKVDFIASDILQCNELNNINLIISNMPFGNRVSTHSENQELYTEFFEKVSNFLANNATLLLYTTEIELIKSCVYKSRYYSIERQIKLESGDMFPSLFIIKFKRK